MVAVVVVVVVVDVDDNLVVFVVGTVTADEKEERAPRVVVGV